jgi:predicted nucleotidyltransferase
MLRVMDASTIASAIGADERTVRRALDRGAIRAERVSPRRIAISDDELDYLRANWSRLQGLQRALRTEPNVAAAILFGSLARGTSVDSISDVDILVELRTDTPLEAARLEERLSDRLGQEVQVVRATATADAPDFLLNVIEDGRPLVDRSGAWNRLKKRRRTLEREARASNAEINQRLSDAFGVEFVDTA